jgi:hypothetical protein
MSSHPPVRNGHPRKDAGKLDEQSSACTKRASTKKAACGEANEQSSIFKMGEAAAAVDRPA